MALRPLADQLLVRADSLPTEYTTSEGVKLAVATDENATLPVGTVIDKGDHVSEVIEKGTRIFFRKYCPEVIFAYDDEGRLIPNLVIVKFEDVLGYDDGKGGQSLQKEKDA